MKIKCDCRGLVRPNAMCQQVMVGGEFCMAPASGLCSHQVVVKEAVFTTDGKTVRQEIIALYDPEDALREEMAWDRELHEAIIPSNQGDA